MALPEAEGRQVVAKALAAVAGMSADAAKVVLAASAKASEPADPVAEFEERRLNGEGLNGDRGNKPAAKASLAVAAAAMVANMKKQIGKKEAA